LKTKTTVKTTSKTGPKTTLKATAKRTPAAALADLSLRDDLLLSTADAARRVGLTAKTLRAMRCDRAGPRCLKLGTSKQARTVYRLSDLERWIRESAHVVGGA
jgi:hypothetical protein